jgi:tetratricopeptide (TPR) repeat protein
MTETFEELFARGYQARRENQLAESRAAFFEAVRKAALEADRPLLAEALCGLAQAERGIGNLEAAAHQFSNAAILYREMGQQERLAFALRHQADVLRELLRFSEAEPLYLEAENIYRQLGEPATLDLANTLRGLALLNKATGRLQESKALWQEARQLYSKCNVNAGIEECDKQLSEHE